MTPSERKLKVSQRRSAAAQRGVVLLFSLIALTIMLIIAVALVRSFNSSLFSAGNIAFKRDLQNQSERAVTNALTYFRSNGGLDTATRRGASVPARNYSATMLATNAEGIPAVLANSDAPDSTFSTTYTVPDVQSTDGSVKLRYVIDRLCTVAGDETTINIAASCRLADNPVPPGGDASDSRSAERNLGVNTKAVQQQTVLYRLSVRVTGPRGTQSFFQSTFTVPTT